MEREMKRMRGSRRTKNRREEGKVQGKEENCSKSYGKKWQENEKRIVEVLSC